MKKHGWISLLISGVSLFSYQGQNPQPGFIFPIDGGRKVTPTVNTQSGLEFEIGYITVTSVDSEGGLNASQDQESTNKLLKQVNELYIQIYNRYQSNAIKNSGNCALPVKQSSLPVQTSCAHRRASKWRQS